MKNLLPILVLSLFGAGCVSAAKMALETERADEAMVKLSAAKKSAAEFKEQLASLQKSNADLQQSLQANKGELSQKLSDMISERDELSRKLAQAEADKKALEEAKANEVAQVKKNYEDLTAGLKSEIAAGEVTITNLKGKLTLNLVDKILFDSGRSEARTAGKKVLDRIAKALNGVKDKDIRIEGHTDNIPISEELRGRYPSNWELSTARATIVARYLQEYGKVDSRRLVAAGYGEFRPVAPNDTPEHRALNRRIEIILVPRD